MVAMDAVSPSVVRAGAQAIAAGYQHSMVVKKSELSINEQGLVQKTAATVWATGKNGHGELGDGTTSGKSSFVQVFSGQ